MNVKNRVQESPLDHRWAVVLAAGDGALSDS